MKSKEPRKYSSPLRESQAKETRERILVAVASWIRDDSHSDFTYDDIAREAGVERRTVFRHFETKEALLEAFWVWINQRILPNTLPQNAAELIDGPRTVFPKFDESDGLIRASLHSRAGRAMRLGTVAARREAFRNVLSQATEGGAPKDIKRLEAVAHALYSAAAWEAMRDYAGVTGAEAGDAAAWALSILIDTVRPAPGAAADDSPTTTD